MANLTGEGSTPLTPEARFMATMYRLAVETKVYRDNEKGRVGRYGLDDPTQLIPANRVRVDAPSPDSQKKDGYYISLGFDNCEHLSISYDAGSDTYSVAIGDDSGLEIVDHKLGERYATNLVSYLEVAEADGRLTILPDQPKS